MSRAAARVGNVLLMPRRPRATQAARATGASTQLRPAQGDADWHGPIDDDRAADDEEHARYVGTRKPAPAHDQDDDASDVEGGDESAGGEGGAEWQGFDDRLADELADEPIDDGPEARGDPRGRGVQGTQREPAAARPRRRAAADPSGAPLQDSADDETLAGWIARMARQDEGALEALYDATAARVHGIARRLTQRIALAEEVLEATYWQAWREAPRFDATRGRPITWLLAIARSRAIDALRREQRFQHEALPEDGEADAASTTDDTTPAPPDLLEATRSHAHVHAALASLEPRSRQLVALAFFRGLTHEEIAAGQGLPLGTVKSLIRRALLQLRRVMEAEHA